MTVAPLGTVVDALREHRLLKPDQADELVQRLLPRFADAPALVEQMRALGWLTSYQAERLLRGDGHELVLHPYILLDRLGEGNMARVFRARHQDRGDVVAIKVLRQEHSSDPRTLRRFRREIQAIAQLAHPNIVRIFDAGQAGDTGFFVMEYVEGIDLGWLVQSLGPLAVDEACDYARQAALGLQHAHEQGLVHRDIKPGNLLLTTGGMVVKILDMGLVRLRQSVDGKPDTVLTTEGTLIGTPDFLAPEQVTDAHTVDHRADLYSLGCTLYYLIAGNPPFGRTSYPEKLLLQCALDPEPIESICPHVPPRLAGLIRRLLAKRPEERCQSAAEVAAELEAIVPGLSPAFPGEG